MARGTRVRPFRVIVSSPPPPYGACDSGGGGVAEENQVYLEATVRQIFAQQMDKLFVLAALPPWPLLLGLAMSFRVYAPTPAGVPGCTKLLSVFAVHAFLSTFGLLGFGFTIHCLLTTNTSCSIVNIILASTVADPSRVNLFLALSFQSWRLGVFRNQSFLLRPRLACPGLPPIFPSWLGIWPHIFAAITGHRPAYGACEAA